MKKAILESKNKNKWACVLFILIFILVLVLLYYFTQEVLMLQKTQSKTRLIETGSYNSERIKDYVNEKKQLVELTGLALSEYDDLESPKALEKIQTVTTNSSFEYMAIDFLDGRSIASDGKTYDIKEYNYLDKIKEGETFITDILPSNLDGRLMISIVSPINKDGVIIGAVRGSILTEEFKTILDSPFFEGNGAMTLADSNGDVIYSSTNEATIEMNDSYFEEFLPIGINRWVLTVSVPKAVIEENAEKINDSARFLIMEILVALLLFFFVLILIMKKSNDDFSSMNAKLIVDEERYRFMLEQMDNIIFEMDLETRVIEYTEKFEKVFGRIPIHEGLPDSVIESGRIHEEDARALLKIFNDIKEGKKSSVAELRIKDINDNYIWCLATVLNIYDDNQKPIKAFGILENVTERKELEAKFKEIQVYKNALDSDRVSIFEVNLTDDCYIKGYEEMIEMSGMNIENCYSKIQEELANSYIHSEDLNEFNQKTSLANLLLNYERDKTEINFDFRMKVGLEKFAWARYKYRIYGDPISKDICAIISLMDINSQKCKEIEWMKKAEEDQLTGLYNKTTTENMIKEYLEKANKTNEMCALLIIDVDNFKNVNDALGHYQGDLVLKEVSAKLKYIFRSDDIVGRLGGDEFFVFMKKCMSTEDVEAKARDIVEAFRIQYQGKEKLVYISASVGIAVSPEDGKTFEELYKRADQSLYISKKSGKDTFT